jgi:hypothetical protein
VDMTNFIAVENTFRRNGLFEGCQTYAPAALHSQEDFWYFIQIYNIIYTSFIDL